MVQANRGGRLYSSFIVAVLSDNVDFTTFGYVYKQETISKTVGTTAVQLLTIDVSQFPAGAVFEAIGGATLTGSDVAPYTTVWVKYGGSDSLSAGAVTTWGRGYFSIGTFVKTSGVDSAAVYSRVDRADAAGNAVAAYLSVKRVG